MAYVKIALESAVFISVKHKVCKKRLDFVTLHVLCEKYGFEKYDIELNVGGNSYLTVKYIEKKRIFKFLAKLEKIGINVVSVDLGYICQS